MRTVKPLGSKILVRQVETNPDLPKSGLIIPPTVSQALKEAVVISTGPGYRINPDVHGEYFSPLQVKKGDRIVYDDKVQMLHIDLPDGEGRYIIMDETAIIAKLEEVPDGA